MPGSMQNTTHTHNLPFFLSWTHTHTHPSFHYKTRGHKRQLFLFYDCIFTFNSIHWSPAVSLVSQAWDSLESSLWLDKSILTEQVYTVLYTYVFMSMWSKCVVPEAQNSFASNEKCSRCLHEDENIINGCARQPVFLFKAASEQKYVTMQWGNVLILHVQLDKKRKINKKSRQPLCC